MAPARSDSPTDAANPSGLADPRHMRDLLPSRLWRLVGVAGAPVTRWCEGQFGVTRREWRVIATLAADGPMLSSQLAEALELDRARTSRALGRLDEMGLVTRTHRAGNARLVQVALAAKGRALFDRLWPVIREHHLRLLAPLSPDETQLLDRLLARITQQAQRLNDDYTDLPKVERRLGRGARPG